MKNLCAIITGLIGFAAPTIALASQVGFTKENAIYYSLTLAASIFPAIAGVHYGSKLDRRINQQTLP